MCGVDGEFVFNGNLSTEQPVATMNDTLSHRGPDDAGLWASDHAILGHRRLAVIDPEHGHQPMELNTAVGKVAITYNGETYNAGELRRELRARGHTFQTSTDTEVVLNGYQQWGTGVFEKIRGMFGVAIWDDRKQELIMARDPVGVKPLYYYKTPDGVVFASEPKALLTHPQIKPIVGLAGWQEMFGASKNPGNSIWSGVQEVKPGSIVTVNGNGIKEHHYWRLQSHEHEDNFEETVARVRGHMERIVHEQLVADVPIGTLLSGGIDSSSITAFAARERAAFSQSIATYALDFIGREQRLNSADLRQTGYDTPFAQEVANMWNTNHTVVELDSLQLAAVGLRERIVRARDAPGGFGDHDVSHLLLFEKIGELCTVALSGENADELFGGYRLFTDQAVLDGNDWSWKLYDPEGHSGVLTIFNAGFLDALDLDTYNADTYATAVSEVEPLPGESVLDHRRRQINYLETTRHIGRLLEYTDLLSMATGLEVRVPFCDHKLMEYVYNVPWNMKAPNGRVKGLLKDAVQDLLPASVLERPKSAYPFTPNPAYLQEIQLQGRELASQKHIVFDIINRKELLKAATKPIDQMRWLDRYAINLALEMTLWIDIYKPSMTTS